MDRIRRAAIITRLIELMRHEGSWCGETHIQKATFVVQGLMLVPLGYDFILYKHGPFSFDLRYDLTGLRADELIRLDPQWPYGPQVVVTNRAQHIQSICSRTIEKYDERIAFVASKLSSKGVAELERLSTALFVTQRCGNGASVECRLAEVKEFKPHISDEHAGAAIRMVDVIIGEAERHIGVDQP